MCEKGYMKTHIDAMDLTTCIGMLKYTISGNKPSNMYVSFILEEQNYFWKYW